MIEVEVAYALSDKQWLLATTIAEAATVREAIQASGILDQVETLELAQLKVGIWGKEASLEAKLKAGDRVEIYRPLAMDPMTARRKRAEKN